MYEKELLFLKNTLKSAYETFCSEKIDVSQKARFDIVTNVDRAIENYFQKELSSAFPGDILHGEEFHKDIGLGDRTWILDPIDGTFNFAAGSPLFGLQAALWDKGDLQISVIYLPALGETYEAVKDGGAYLDGNKLSVSRRSVEESVFAFGDLPHQRPDDTAFQWKVMHRAQEKIAKLRMFGAASVDFAFLASQRTEGVLLMTKNKWDIAPGFLLAREAGAFVRGVSDEAYSFESRGIFACNRAELYYEIMDEVLEK